MNFYTNDECYCETCMLIKGFLISFIVGLSGKCNCKFTALKKNFTPKEKIVPSLQILTYCYLLNRGEGFNLHNSRSDFSLSGSFLCRICYRHQPLEYKRNYGKEIIHNGTTIEICEYCYPRKYSKRVISFLVKRLKCTDLRIIVPSILKYSENLDNLIKTCEKEIKLYKQNSV